MNPQSRTLSSMLVARPEPIWRPGQRVFLDRTPFRLYAGVCGRLSAQGDGRPGFMEDWPARIKGTGLQVWLDLDDDATAGTLSGMVLDRAEQAEIVKVPACEPLCVQAGYRLIWRTGHVDERTGIVESRGAAWATALLKILTDNKDAA